MDGLPIAPLVGLGLLFFATPLIVLILVLVLLSMRSRVRRLEARLAELEQRSRIPATSFARGVASGTPGASEPPAATAARVDVPEPAPAVETSVEPADVPSTAPDIAPPVAATVEAERDPEPSAAIPPVSPSVPEPAASPGLGQWEGRLGGTWLSRVGAILLLLGVGFFLKHAFEHDWVGPRGRVLAGLAAGIALMASGARLAGGGTYQAPGQSLVALGMGVLYLSLYATHAFYALAPPPPTFVAMAVVTAAGFGIALRLGSRPLAVLATVGGLLTPVVLDAGVEATTALFTYLLILDLGVLAAALYRGWFGVALLAFVGTQALYWGWLDRFDEGDAPVVTALGWASAYFLAFAATALAGPRAPRPSGTVDLGRTLLILAAPAVYFVVAREVLDDPSGRRLALLALGIAGLYWVAARAAAGSPRGGPRVALFHRAVALGFLALAPAVTLGRQDLVIAWSVTGLVLLGGGFALQAPRLRAGGLLISLLAWARWLAAIDQDAGRAGTFLLAHPALPATMVVAVAAALGALAYRTGARIGASIGRWERIVPPILLVVAVGSVALLLTVELGQFRTLAIPPPYVPIMKSVVWMLAAMALLALARGDDTRLLLLVTTLLLVALVGEAMGGMDRWARIQPSLRPVVWNPRFLAGCLLVVVVWLYGQSAGSLSYLGDLARRRLLALGAVTAALLLLWNLSVEIMLAPLPETRFNPTKLRMAALSVLWAVYAFTTMAWGFWRGHAPLRVVAIALFLVTLLKVLVVDLAGLDALYRILSVAVLGAVLLVASFLYARARRPAT